MERLGLAERRVRARSTTTTTRRASAAEAGHRLGEAGQEARGAEGRG